MLEPTLIVIAFIILVTVLLVYMNNQVSKFYQAAYDLEKRIRWENDEEGQFADLIALQKQTSHWRTSARVRELAKMMEIKYHTEILKH